ncbi:superoxide dismutase [Cu-Zn]-like isoform X2 [Mercurialis annua]|uniref:superoxide dismutase [Cu-Zn]-like isoform X2 n=1 Tax=Mercurialis annua TaxID=3986 RepID=UPI00215E4F18|nr:superoxide dismutase [Cu-Zn]-like isoform X2 [Mercurialis annua]
MAIILMFVMALSFSSNFAEGNINAADKILSTPHTTSWKASAEIKGRAAGVRGDIYFRQLGEGPTTLHGMVSGLQPGLHGMHIHTDEERIDCLATKSIGPHFNPAEKEHGGPGDEIRHAGDLGNIIVGEDGTANFTITGDQIPLTGKNNIMGMTIDIHSNPDDCGKGGNELSKTTGNAGERIACGYISFEE